jgi:hypothetical protein
MITSRQQLVDYCLRKLGHPVIEINVDDDQVSDRIDEALQMYQEYNSDSMVLSYVKYEITQDDIDNKYITVPEQLAWITRVVPVDTGSGSGGMFNAQYQMALNDVYSIRGGLIGNLSYYAQSMQHMSLISSFFSSGTDATIFSRHMNRLFLMIDWTSDLKVGDTILIESYTIIDPDTFTDIYNDMFLKKYATALIKLQWGQNMSKFEGMQLPGGVTINSRQMIDDAREEILKLEEDLQLRYELPPDFFMG